MNKVINKYLISGFLKTVFNVILIFLCLGVILNLFEEIEFFKDLDEDIMLPFVLTLMYVPNLLIQLLPFIIFISAMWYLISIKSNTDLISLKIFGYSNLRVISILSITSLLFGIIVLFAINPLTSSMIKYYEITKAKYAKDIDHLVTINKNGVWIKEGEKNNFRIISAKKLVGNILHDVTIYEIDEDYSIKRRVEGKKANISDNLWIFDRVTIFNFKDKKIDTTFKDKFTYYSIYNGKKLSSLFRNLDTIFFINLIIKKDNLIARGYSPESLKEKMHSLISLPIFLFLMVLLASIFTIGTNSKLQNTYYVFISIIVCVLIYYFKDLSVALGQTNRMSLVLSIWMPIIAIGLFCSIGILQINEKSIYITSFNFFFNAKFNYFFGV